jgi:hypothetical protein
MKSYLKLFALIGAVTLSAVMLSACQHQDNTPPPPPPAPMTPPPPASQPGS